MRTRTLLTGGLIAVGLSAFGISTAGPASAHDLNGGSAQKTCVPGDGVDVTWTFTSSNATGHHIVSVTFDRAVQGYSFTPDTVTAHTNEVAGTSVSLNAAVVFEDGFHSNHTVSTTIPTDLCPVTTTVPPTTVPPTTVPPTTAPPTTVPPEVTTVPPTTTPPTVVDTTIPGSDTSIVQTTPPTTACRSDVSVEKPLGPGEVVCSLPTTGGDAGDVAAAAFGTIFVASCLILIARRPRRPVA